MTIMRQQVVLLFRFEPWNQFAKTQLETLEHKPLDYFSAIIFGIVSLSRGPVLHSHDMCHMIESSSGQTLEVN